MAWTCLILIVSVWIHWSSRLLAEFQETKEKEWLGVWGSHISHSWVPLEPEVNCIILWQNSLLSFAHPELHFPSSWWNNQTCHGPNKGQSITFSFKQCYLNPVVFSVFIYCSWSWNTFRMWFARAPARSQPSRGALAGLLSPQGVQGWGAWLLLPWERLLHLLQGEEFEGLQGSLASPGSFLDMCAGGREWTNGACSQDSTRREVCALGKWQQRR